MYPLGSQELILILPKNSWILIYIVGESPINSSRWIFDWNSYFQGMEKRKLLSRMQHLLWTRKVWQSWQGTLSRKYQRGRVCLLLGLLKTTPLHMHRWCWSIHMPRLPEENARKVHGLSRKRDLGDNGNGRCGLWHDFRLYYGHSCDSINVKIA